jgi:hypothetical protein
MPEHVRVLGSFQLFAVGGTFGYELVRKNMNMDVVLKQADRNNWRTMVRLQLKPEQQGFVSPPA